MHFLTLHPFVDPLSFSVDSSCCEEGAGGETRAGEAGTTGLHTVRDQSGGPGDHGKGPGEWADP